MKYYCIPARVHDWIGAVAAAVLLAGCDLSGDGSSGTGPRTGNRIWGMAAGGFSETGGILPLLADPVHFTEHDSSARMARVIDLNGDGYSDVAALIVTELDTGPGNGQIRFLINLKDSTFLEETVIDEIPEATGLAADDLNGDGILDFAVTSTALGQLQVFLGQAGGSFTALEPIEIDIEVESAQVDEITDPLTSVDANGDGNPDLVVQVGSGTYSGSAAQMLFGNGNGTFTPGQRIEFTTGPVFSLEFADFNRDGRIDMVAALDGGLSSTDGVPGGLEVFLQNAEAQFTPILTEAGIPPGANHYRPGIAVLDADEDGNLDIVFNGRFVLLGDGAGAFTRIPQIAPLGLPNHTVAVDVDLDGHVDLVGWRAFIVENLQVALGLGDGTFSTAESFQGERSFLLAVADWNADELPDFLAMQHWDGKMLLTMKYNVGSSQILSNVKISEFMTAVGDTNADGLPDCLRVSEAGSQFKPAGFIGYGDLEFLGPAPFTQLPNIATQEEPGARSLADVTGDGRADLLILGSIFRTQNALFNILPGKVDGQFDSTRLLQLDLGRTSAGGRLLTGFDESVGVASFDGNANPDAVLTLMRSGGISEIMVILEVGTDSPALRPTPLVTGNVPGAPLEPGELTGDGLVDVVVGTPNGFDLFAGIAGVYDGYFASPPTSHILADVLIDFDLGDIDTDSDVDLIATTIRNPGAKGEEYELVVAMNDGSGMFSSALSSPLPDQIQGRLGIGDVNADGFLDVVVVSASLKLTLLLGHGDGSFEPWLNYGMFDVNPESFNTIVDVSDLESDGDIDVLGVEDWSRTSVVLVNSLSLEPAPGIEVATPSPSARR